MATFLRSSIGVGLINIFNLFAALVTGVVLARVLGPQDYGVYAFVISLVSIAAIPINAGLPILLIRETAKSRVEKAWGELRGLLQLSSRAVWVFTALSVVIGLALYASVLHSITNWLIFVITLALIPSIAISNLQSAVVKGMGNVLFGQLPGYFIRPLVLLLMLSVAFLAQRQLTAELALVFHLFAVMVGLGFAYIFMRHMLKSADMKAPIAYKTEQWRLAVVPLTMFAAMKIADSQLNVLLLGFLGSAEQVAFLRVAIQGSTLIVFALTALNIVLTPRVASLYSQANYKQLQKLLTMVSWAAMLAALPLAVAFFVAGDVIIEFLFGAAFSPAAPALVVLAIGQLFMVSTGTAGVVLNMTGLERFSFYTGVVAIALNVVLALILIPFYGVMGSAISTMVSLIVWNLSMALVVKAKLGFNCFIVPLPIKTMQPDN